uniref:Uncharacterized protein n=1 Tax=Pseudopediastrum boryanum TaxID=55410 RepID=A0A2U8GJN2_PSEBY|nr:hypothetical protein [Pseudopediastrum boryanum]YP_009492117.1 hypothetical protein [Pseudopediastrum boryanum]AWI68661.1 hypothetical protein [Pseudopediastrum boryanum]AWI68662.1 hypothetical protein [Pseudopediastrum boryanum]
MISILLHLLPPSFAFPPAFACAKAMHLRMRSAAKAKAMHLRMRVGRASAPKQRRSEAQEQKLCIFAPSRSEEEASCLRMRVGRASAPKQRRSEGAQVDDEVQV